MTGAGTGRVAHLALSDVRCVFESDYVTGDNSL